MNLESTGDNRGLAAVVNARVRADTRMVSARAALWRLGGLGLLCLLLGGGVGLALYGYSYSSGASSVDRLAEAFTAALERVHPEIKIKLEDGVVKLAPNATVGLDPNARVSVSDAVMPHPSPAQLGNDVAPQSQAHVVTNYVVFKHVALGKGSVVTGWEYDSSEQATPSTQFCYYREPVEQGSSLRTELAQDGKPLPQVSSREGFDASEAVSKCIWFGHATEQPGRRT